MGKGIKSGTVGGISEPITHAAQVRAEGSHVIAKFISDQPQAGRIARPAKWCPPVCVCWKNMRPGRGRWKRP